MAEAALPRLSIHRRSRNREHRVTNSRSGDNLQNLECRVDFFPPRSLDRRRSSLLRSTTTFVSPFFAVEDPHVLFLSFTDPWCWLGRGH